MNSYASSGVLPKEWVTVNGVEYLVKGNSVEGFESICEVLASRLGKFFGFNVVEYKLAENNGRFKDFGKYLCYCRRFPVKTYRLYSLIDSSNNESRWLDYESISLLESLIENLGVGFVKELAILLVFDFLIGNSDRHLNNVEVMYTSGNNLTLTPYLDFGHSLLAPVGDDVIMSGHYLNYDVAQPLESTHKEQLNLIRDYVEIKKLPFEFINKTFEELNDFFKEQGDIESILGVKRMEAIKTYVTYRLKYIKQVLKLS